MKEKIENGIFATIILLIVILVFTIIDHYIHGLEQIWSVPDYYFKDKIPAGFFCGIIGFLLAKKVNNIWLKSIVFSGIISLTLQFRYLIEGYALDFVLLFLLIHFIILFILSIFMFKVYNKYINNQIKK